MSAALTLPYVWAEASRQPAERIRHPQPLGGLAFYRKRTEMLLRRYMRVSMDMGRVPSVMGNLEFRGRGLSYRIKNFEDAVIFDLSVLKNQMSTLLGDGNSGRIAAIENRVSQHDQSLQRAKGFAVASGVVFTLVQFVMEIVRRK